MPEWRGADMLVMHGVAPPATPFAYNSGAIVLKAIFVLRGTDCQNAGLEWRLV
jgi:hypothetical protein